MKTIEATLLAHQALPVTTMCLLVHVQCVGAFDGEEYGFTNLDIDVTYDPGAGSVLFESDNGFTPMAVAQTSGVSVDSSELVGVIDDTGITEARVRAGLFRGAKVTVYRVNYNDLTSGRHEVVAYGRAGETIYHSLGWSTEFRSLSQLLKQTIGAVYSLTCRAVFGDVKCGKSFIWASGTVSSVGTENDRVFSDASRWENDDYYNLGVIRWLTGDNAGHEVEVDDYAGLTSGGDFALSFGMPYPIQVGDTYEVRKDCSKVHDDAANGCLFHWGADWIYHFRGEPLIPVDGTAMVPGAEIQRA